MNRFLKIWSLLFAVNVVGRVLLDYWLFGLLELRDFQISEWLILPTFQGFVLWWITEPADLRAIGRQVGAAAVRCRLLMVFCVVDVVLLCAAWIAGAGHWLSLSTDKGFIACYLAAKAALAGVWILMRVDQWSTSLRRRLWFGLLAVGLCLYALSAVTGWLRELPHLVLAGFPLLVRWILIYGILFAVAIGVLLKTTHWIRARSGPAGLFLDATIGFALMACLPAILNTYDYRDWHQPWLNLHRTFEFLAVGSLWLGVLDLRASERAGTPSAGLDPKFNSQVPI